MRSFRWALAFSLVVGGCSAESRPRAEDSDRGAVEGPRMAEDSRGEFIGAMAGDVLAGDVLTGDVETGEAETGDVETGEAVSREAERAGDAEETRTPERRGHVDRTDGASGAPAIDAAFVSDERAALSDERAGRHERSNSSAQPMRPTRMERPNRTALPARNPTPTRIENPTPATPRFSDEDYARHVAALKKQLPGEGFHVLVERPFVVIGDESPEGVRQRAERTVRWAVRLLKKDFFGADPNHILDIWLFKNKASYEKHAQRLTGSPPHTPFGFYSPSQKALIMNISTGGGTLVHEIVHPFVAADFPNCPAWFNEGLGSLYEQSSEREGQIRGLTNWRLSGLQRAIREGRVPPFETLCGTTTNEFYNEDRGTNYAQARYLCYYLQEQGKLRTFYRRFRADCRDDPTGYQTLQAVLGANDMERFQKEWERFVLMLKFSG